MIKLNKIIFGKLNVPGTKESNKSAQFTANDFLEITKSVNVRMYPNDSYTGQTVERTTRTSAFVLSDWKINSI